MKKAFVDLHVHLDGTLNLKWSYERALKIGDIEPEVTFEEYYRRMHPNNPSDENMFVKFDMPLNLMQDEEGIIDCIYSFCREQSELGVIYSEFRFGPQKLTRQGLTQEESVIAAIKGCEKAMKDFPIIVKIINCFLHEGKDASVNHQANMETLRVTKKYLGKYVAAVDLAGYENNCDLDEYANLFEMAKKENVPFTIHAGEMGIGENVVKAIKMGTSRIGHGINAVQDDEYIQALVDNDITLEVCPTSNCSSFGYTYASHPIHKLYEKGVKITVNTDDGTFDNNNLPYEFEMLRNVGFTDEQFRVFTNNAIDASFATEEEKQYLRKIVND